MAKQVGTGSPTSFHHYSPEPITPPLRVDTHFTNFYIPDLEIATAAATRITGIDLKKVKYRTTISVGRDAIADEDGGKTDWFETLKVYLGTASAATEIKSRKEISEEYLIEKSVKLPDKE